MSHTNVVEVRDNLRAFFRSGGTRSVSWRRRQLKALRRLIKENEDQLTGALHSDLGKSNFEAWVTEVNVIINELDHTLRHFEDWMEPEPVQTPVVVQPASSTIHREALGTVLVIGPWNYPVQIGLLPLIPALAAGNTVLLKPSEVAAATSKVLAELVPKYLDPRGIAVIEGGIPETTEILEQQWDHIFFTGSTQVGRIVMQAAAKHLTPVTLELGGKTPVIIDETAKLGITANRLLWGKIYNAGQTCVAPDYLLVHKSKEEALYAALRKSLNSFFPEGVATSRDYGRIIHHKHFDRLVGMLEGQSVVLGGEHNRDDLFIAPTVLRDVSVDSKVMSDEIFGPLLPVLTYERLDEAIDFINDRPKPLALYIFSQRRANQERVLAETSSGGASINQVMMHLGVPDLPFGGVGASGMGAYHGRAGFESFSHRRSVFKRSTLMDPPVIYPPYTDFKVKFAKKLI